MKELVALAKDADAKKSFSSTRSDKSIHHVRNAPERQLGSLRSVIGNIRHDGGTPTLDSIATELGSMHTAQRASVLLALQRTHGNRYVQRVVTGIQAKLKVGQPGDVYEQEADRVADEVRRMPEPRMQRQPLEEEEEKIQTKPLAGQITPSIQRQVKEEEEILQTKNVSNHTQEVTPNLESRIQALWIGGQSLSESVRAFFEPRFGYDFSQVCIHTDAEANMLSGALNARAFTTGQDIFFSQGAYNLGSTSGRELLAHELTHVMQQNGGKLQRRLTVGPPGYRYEQKALRVARAFMQREEEESKETRTTCSITKAVRGPLSPVLEVDGKTNLILGVAELYRFIDGRCRMAGAYPDPIMKVGVAAGRFWFRVPFSATVTPGVGKKILVKVRVGSESATCCATVRPK